MRIIVISFILSLLLGCADDKISYISIRNQTTIPIYVLPYASSFSDGGWIQPGVTDEFYSIEINHLNGYEYFTAYYDSLIVYIKGYDDEPVKFYKDGTTVNYDPDFNPFINPDVWVSHSFDTHLRSSGINTLEEKQIYEDFFSIDAKCVISLADSVNLYPAP